MRLCLKDGRGGDACRRHYRPGSLTLRARHARTGNGRPERNPSGDDGSAGGYGGSALHFNRTELDLGLPRTTADRVQLQQVLMNLMLNGIEAMRETGGELTIASKKAEHGQLLVSVSDSGIGLPVDE